MSLETRLTELAQRAGTGDKAIKTLVNGNAADLAALNTTAKANLVDAVNEVAASVGSAAGIDDASVSTSSTWSSSKTSGEITGASTADRARANHTGTQPSSTITGLAAVATTGAYSDMIGTVPSSALPAIAVTEYLGEVATEAAMLALSGQRGDWTTRTDLGSDWILIADTPGSIASWREITTPTSPVSSVNGRTGAVTGLAEASSIGNTEIDLVAVFDAALV